MFNLALNITNGDFTPDEWNQMVIQAKNNNEELSNQKYICRVIYPNRNCTLELKTNQQIKEHFERHGSWTANCVKMRLGEVINITRINSLNEPVTELQEPLNQALNHMAARAEEKYNRNFWGSLRKVFSIILNFFTSDSVELFDMPNADRELVIIDPNKRHRLPFFIGSNAEFARQVARGL